MLVDKFVTETFFHDLRYIFSRLFIVHQLEAPSTDSIQEDDFTLHDCFRCIKTCDPFNCCILTASEVDTTMFEAVQSSFRGKD